MVVSQLREERMAQLRQLQEQKRQLEAELNMTSVSSFPPNPDSTGSPPLAPSPSAWLSPGRKAITEKLELIHSGLQGEEEEEEEEQKWAHTEQRLTGGRRIEESPAAAAGDGGPAGGIQDLCKAEASSFSPKPVEGSGPRNQTEPSCEVKEERDREETTAQGAAACDTTTRPPGGDRPRDSRSDEKQAGTATGAPPAAAAAAAVTMDRDDRPNATAPGLLPTPQQPPLARGLLPRPHVTARLPGYHFPPGPLASLAGIQGLLGPTAVWPGGLNPSGALLWGPRPQQPRVDSCRPVLWYPPLVGGYHSAAGQGGSRYRGGQRGGGCHKM